MSEDRKPIEIPATLARQGIKEVRTNMAPGQRLDIGKDTFFAFREDLIELIQSPEWRCRNATVTSSTDADGDVVGDPKTQGGV